MNHFRGSTGELDELAGARHIVCLQQRFPRLDWGFYAGKGHFAAAGGSPGHFLEPKHIRHLRISLMEPPGGIVPHLGSHLTRAPKWVKSRPLAAAICAPNGSPRALELS